MLTTLTYLIGTLSLHFTDLASPNGFFSLLLPAINILFFIFIIFQLVFFFSMDLFTGDDDFHFSDLLREFWNLNYNIRELGLARALLRFSLHAIDTGCFFAAVYYYLTLFLNFS